MRILLIFTIYSMSGPVTCSDVISYSGGSVIIFSNIKWYTHDSKFICKVKENDCSDIIRADTKRSKVQDGRFLLYSNSNKQLLVLIRKLKPQDAGTYRFGLGNQDNSTVNLKVYNKRMSTTPQPTTQVTTTMTSAALTETPTGAVYFMGLSTTIQTTTTTTTGSTNMTRSSSQKGIPSTVCFSSFTLIIVCVFAALLLIGGFSCMIYKLRCKRTQEYTFSFKSKANKPVTSNFNTGSENVYENSVNSL
ncbi:uncharacterized protein LOC124399106 isoform X2 [Silurus meridionalis]|uniref:uncharacterized protein LOC124399106 isoform X2 n=1 Tax=Silurus meridionalis TaxID=175797 RepID=UPI001EEB703D|nr:uncharacterized protein LOC124399106 isoform X2 [Silurus meridionalis]